MIPFDILLPRVRPQQLRRAVADAAAVHMNMLRVWGGGGYLPAAFYESCDEAGLLVWQEAMFACACYPRDSAFLAEVRIAPLGLHMPFGASTAAIRMLYMEDVQVREEVRQQAWRLGQHTCLALWGGNNEVEQALGWSPESTKNPLLYAVDYAELFVHTVRKALQEVMGALLCMCPREGCSGHAWLKMKMCAGEQRRHLLG